MTNEQQQRNNGSQNLRSTDRWLRRLKGGRLVADAWPCICGHVWGKCPQGSRTWRNHPAELNPFDQWFSENMPSGREGTTAMDIDKLIRGYSAEDGIGYLVALEIKTMGGSIQKNYAELQSIKGLNDSRLLGVFVLEMNGNTPGPLNHYPEAWPGLGLPRPPVVSTEMWVYTPTVEGTEVIGPVTEGVIVASLNGQSLYQAAAPLWRDK